MTKIPKKIVMEPSTIYSHCQALYPWRPARPFRMPAAIRLPKAPEMSDPE